MTTSPTASPADQRENLARLHLYVAPVDARLDAHLKAAAPILLGLATMVVANSDAVANPAAVARSFIDYPPPDNLVAKGLRLLAETCHNLAAELDP